jgi:hypothetical protein
MIMVCDDRALAAAQTPAGAAGGHAQPQVQQAQSAELGRTVG